LILDVENFIYLKILWPTVAFIEQPVFLCHFPSVLWVDTVGWTTGIASGL